MVDVASEGVREWGGAHLGFFVKIYSPCLRLVVDVDVTLDC